MNSSVENDQIIRDIILCNTLGDPLDEKAQKIVDAFNNIFDKFDILTVQDHHKWYFMGNMKYMEIYDETCMVYSTFLREIAGMLNEPKGYFTIYVDYTSLGKLFQYFINIRYSGNFEITLINYQHNFTNGSISLNTKH
tara:strand:- start:35796 stop:36209 length:414 start_codon:yes stop_codon:yes gene_type:complete